MHVALLRSVNLGKQRKVSMAALRALFADLGYPGARTYIQSGNVVFAAPGEDEAALAVKLRAAIEAMTGFEVAVVVRSAAAWEEAVRACPFDPGAVSVAAAFLGAGLRGGAVGGGGPHAVPDGAGRREERAAVARADRAAAGVPSDCA